MGESTKIEWADSTLNIWFGCTKVSPACDHCYAEAWGKRTGLAQWGDDAPRVQAKHWRSALAVISRRAWAAKRPWFVFVNSLSDFFDNRAPDEWRAEGFAEMRKHPHLTFLLVTKRIGNAYRNVELAGGLPPNCAVIITVINQREADRDIPVLLRLRQNHEPRFVGLSVEPMLGPILLTQLSTMRYRGTEVLNGLTGELFGILGEPIDTLAGRIDWVICGGESGPHARPMHPDWARSLRDQCAAARVPFLFKQHGEWIGVEDLRDLSGGSGPGFGAFDHCPFLVDLDVVRVGKKAAGRMLDGRTHDDRPVEAS